MIRRVISGLLSGAFLVCAISLPACQTARATTPVALTGQSEPGTRTVLKSHRNFKGQIYHTPHTQRE